MCIYIRLMSSSNKRNIHFVVNACGFNVDNGCVHELAPDKPGYVLHSRSQTNNQNCMIFSLRTTGSLPGSLTERPCSPSRVVWLTL